MKALAVLLLLSSCSLYKTKTPEQPYRTFWEICWGNDDIYLVPSDSPPHTPHCSNPEIIKWPRSQVRLLDLNTPFETEIDRAIAQWNEWLGFEIFVRTEMGFDVMVINTEPNYFLFGMAQVFKEAGVMGGVITLYSPPGGVAYRVILHEMGHILGLAHDIHGRGYLMDKNGATVHGEELAPEDCEALRKLYQAH